MVLYSHFCTVEFSHCNLCFGAPTFNFLPTRRGRPSRNRLQASVATLAYVANTWSILITDRQPESSPFLPNHTIWIKSRKNARSNKQTKKRVLNKFKLSVRIEQELKYSRFHFRPYHIPPQVFMILHDGHRLVQCWTVQIPPFPILKIWTAWVLLPVNIPDIQGLLLKEIK
jgi:hypothetical protein